MRMAATFASHPHGVYIMRLIIAAAALLLTACPEPFEPGPVQLTDMPAPAPDMELDAVDMAPEVIEYTYDGPFVVEDV